MEGTDNYVDMSLDDVIRDMKAKKASQEGEIGEEDNSPFLRKPGWQQKNYHNNNNNSNNNIRNGQRQHWSRRRRPGNDRSNYLNHMARRKVANARKTLDLRQRLITIRANRQGLDLRWKIVANMIFKMRQKGYLQRQQQQQQQQQMNQIHRLNPHGMGGCGVQRCASRSTISQIERLVGRLPSWMKPIRTVHPSPSASVFSPTPTTPSSGIGIHPAAARYGMELQQQIQQQQQQQYPPVFAVPAAPRPAVVAQVVDPYAGMPPLAYAPPPPVKISTLSNNRIGLMMKSADADEDDIEIHVNEDNSVDQYPKIKKTLNERFTH